PRGRGLAPAQSTVRTTERGRRGAREAEARRRWPASALVAAQAALSKRDPATSTGSVCEIQPFEGQVGEDRGLIGEDGVVEDDEGGVVVALSIGGDIGATRAEHEVGSRHLTEHEREVLAGHDRLRQHLHPLASEQSLEPLERPRGFGSVVY